MKKKNIILYFLNAVIITFIGGLAGYGYDISLKNMGSSLTGIGYGFSSIIGLIIYSWYESHYDKK